MAVQPHDVAGRAARPVHFVPGNRDFYRGPIAEVREKVRSLCPVTPNPLWLPGAGVVPPAGEACWVGHDGRGDGRRGDFHSSDVMPNDFGLIEEFGGFEESADEGRAGPHALGGEAAEHFRAARPDASQRFRHVTVATHVPPFREARA